MPKKRKSGKPTPTSGAKKLTPNISHFEIQGHGRCTIFEVPDGLYAVTEKNKIIISRNQGTSWKKASEPEDRAFRVFLRKYSEQEKGH